MPILTCPFNAIPKQGIEAKNIAYPEKTVLSTELSIKPTATEIWSVEGLSLQFTTNYASNYFVNIEKAKAYLTEVIKFYSEAAATEQHQWEKSGGTGLAPGNATNTAAQRAAENERAQLGIEAAREGIKTPPLIIVARLYARGNELIWTNELTPLRFSHQVYQGSEEFDANRLLTTIYEWNETLNDHVQFDDPIDFTERENLKLTLEFTGPPKGDGFVSYGPEVYPGLLEGFPILNRTGVILSEVQTVVNYSRTVAGEKE